MMRSRGSEEVTSVTVNLMKQLRDVMCNMTAASLQGSLKLSQIFLKHVAQGECSIYTW